MDDSVSIIYEQINPRPEIVFSGVVLNSEENVKDQQAFGFPDRPSFAEQKTTVENPFHELEEDSSKKIPQVNQTGVHELEVSFNNQNVLDTIPGIMLNTETLPTLEEPLEILEHFDQETLPRRSKRKVIYLESQDEVVTQKEEPSLKIQITKTSPSNWKVDNIKKLKIDQPIQQQARHPSRQAYDDFMRRVRHRLLPDDEEPAMTAPNSTASTSVNHNWAYQSSEQQSPPHDPQKPRFSTNLDARIQNLRTKHNWTYQPLPSEQQPPPHDPHTNRFSANFDAHIQNLKHNWTYQHLPSEQPPLPKDTHTPRMDAADLAVRIQNLCDLQKRITSKRFLTPADRTTTRTSPLYLAASTSSCPPPNNREDQPPASPLSHKWRSLFQPPQEEPCVSRFSTSYTLGDLNILLGSLHPSSPDSIASTSAHPPPLSQDNQPIRPEFPPSQQQSLCKKSCQKKHAVHEAAKIPPRTCTSSPLNLNSLIPPRLPPRIPKKRVFHMPRYPAYYDGWVKMAPYPLRTLPSFLTNVPEPTTADKPQPQESFQKEKKLKTWKEEFEKDDYNTLVAMSDRGLVANVEPFECPICFLEIPMGEGVLLHECLHSFCRECLEGTIKHSDTAFVRCPFANEDYLCESHLQEREIKALVTPDLFEKYLARSLVLAESQAPDSFHCKTPDCPGWCLIGKDVVVFMCPVCQRTNCLSCGAVHEGRSCREYQDWLLELESDTSNETKKTRKCLKDMVAQGKAMECPVCHVILMKVSGCDALTCRMCKTQLCWVTKGTRWGPKGHGDTSGGCKCNLNGVPCHPQCTGCH